MAENIFECVRDVTPQLRSSSELTKSLDLGQESANSGPLQYICTKIESFDLTSGITRYLQLQFWLFLLRRNKLDLGLSKSKTFWQWIQILDAQSDCESWFIVR